MIFMKTCSTGHLSKLSSDPYLKPYLQIIQQRHAHACGLEHKLTLGQMPLTDFASGHEYFGMHKRDNGWVFREWAPNAETIYLTGSFCDWRESPDYQLRRIDGNGTWEIVLPEKALHHGDLYRLSISWPGGRGDRIPAYARRVVQDEKTKIFNAQIWAPEKPYKWRHDKFTPCSTPLIYETHVGISQQNECVGTYTQFKDNVLPRIADAGYNTIQLMAIMEHPYYGSFGYHVSSFFAASSRFGTPDEFKALVDEAHGAGLAVIIDIVHSHAVKNEVEGLSRFDGTLYQYFHEGARGEHKAWDSRCFNYAKPEVVHFLLSNCRFWLDEYRVDGFRFDGVTSMLYFHHGLGPAFTSYDNYFDNTVDEDAVAYLMLANKVIHTVKPDAITIAEDVSGMPGLAVPPEQGGCGFDYRMAMGVPDCWFKLVNDVSDENWTMSYLWHELVNRRQDERTISYAECHDQALVGGKTLIFELIDAEMYHFMRTSDNNLMVDRGMALHKMIRLASLTTAGHGYLNFMGNEFGHPEWVDFPREGNNWSYHYARRQWHLRDNTELKYHQLAAFDVAMIEMVKEKNTIAAGLPRLILLREEEKIIIFERSGLFFFFNFHPSSSVADYTVELPPGEYTLVMNTDETRFGGQGRIKNGQCYIPKAFKDKSTLRHLIQIYLPCRVAMVLARS